MGELTTTGPPGSVKRRMRCTTPVITSATVVVRPGSNDQPHSTSANEAQAEAYGCDHA